MNPVDTANFSLNIFDRIKSRFIRVKITPEQASFMYVDSGEIKYTQVGVPFYADNKTSRSLLITDARAFVKLQSEEIAEGKLSPVGNRLRNTLEPNKISDLHLTFNFFHTKFQTEDNIKVILHFDARKIKSFDAELVPLEELSKRRKGTIDKKALEKQKKSVK
ncbi:MAG: hypothetical protein ACP5N3_02085 [Candidatus Nanoarchaeia archaeon]